MTGLRNSENKPWDPRERLSEIQPVLLDGIPHYPLKEVCRAFRIGNQSAASRLIPAGCKRYVYRRVRRFDSRRYCCITADGVYALGLRYGRVPLSQIMDALQEESKA